MVLPLYLAMTPGEMTENFPISSHPACLSAHFSPWGSGLSGVPEALPPGSILILDDRTPMDGHDPVLIRDTLAQAVGRCRCEAVLLDFQRPGSDSQQELARLLTASLPCPVGVSECYARELSCAVFLPPAPPDRPLKTHLAPWLGQEIWLEAALNGITLNLTPAGCSEMPLMGFPEAGFRDKGLHCHYSIDTAENSARFHLWRTAEDLRALLAEAESYGVAKAIGLWQELGNYKI